MSKKLLILVAVACFFAPIKGDNITDIIEAGNKKIEELSNGVGNIISEGLTTISETREYAQNTVETFSREGQEHVTKAETNLNTTEAELIIQAIEENAGEKVLECIANKHNAAITNIAKAHTTFLSNLAEAQSSGDATINLAETIIGVAAYDLPILLEENKQKIATCVSQVCVDNNLSIIQTEYNTLSTNLSAETDKVKAFRTKFTQDSSDLNTKFGTTVTNDENTGIKQMKKCF